MKRVSGGVLLAAASVAAAGCAGSHPAMKQGVAPLPSTDAKRTFAHAILRQARDWGDPHPTSVVVIPTTQRKALRIQPGVSDTSRAPETPAYLVVAHGQFVARDMPRPRGAASPTGRVLALTFDASTNRSLGVSLLRKRHVALRGVGKPEPLPLTAHPAIRYRSEGVAFYPPRPGYRPPVSRIQVIDYSGRRLVKGPKLTGRPSVQLRVVNDGNPNPKDKDYPGWVLTYHHAGCAWVSVFDLSTRTWSLDFKSCPKRPAPPSRTPPNQPALDAAASYAEQVTGDAHVFAGDEVDDAANKVIVHLAHAPQSVIAELRARHPGTYVIHNDAPRTLHAVMTIAHQIDPAALKSKGIHVVEWGPTEDGYLRVGVTSHIARAQAYFDAKYGRGIVRVFHGEPSIAVSATG